MCDVFLCLVLFCGTLLFVIFLDNDFAEEEGDGWLTLMVFLLLRVWFCFYVF